MEVDDLHKMVVGVIGNSNSGKTTLINNLQQRVDDCQNHVTRLPMTLTAEPHILTNKDLQITLIDTAGQPDLITQTENVIKVLDYAIFVLTANSGIQGTDLILWRLLRHYQVPEMIEHEKYIG
ncbi:GTP-binding protein [uncultured Limosilactobacillus sp.]|uniref:GTP-binding protein n=1 Tax=uncultured Limosilactobacillus sp. TaxID=2837629 RepID=UPI0025FF5E5F|nr:GTP-binding protein [uncultured Limosilactobacillus sp.]